MPPRFSKAGGLAAGGGLLGAVGVTGTGFGAGGDAQAAASALESRRESLSGCDVMIEVAYATSPA
jgi:hypothetical protein